MKITPYLDWVSEVSVDDLLNEPADRQYPTLVDGGLIYLAPVKTERKAVNTGLYFVTSESDHDPHLLTPKSYDVGIDIHEYGGKPFWVNGEQLVFVNRTDSCLYRLQLGVFKHQASSVERVSVRSNHTGKQNYTDINWLSNDQCLAICESHLGDGQEPKAAIVYLDFSRPDKPAETIQEGADFYSNLVIDPATKKLAWVEWNHPTMPWDANTLVTAQVEDSHDDVPKLVQLNRIDNEEQASYCQLCFAGDAQLFLVADFVTGNHKNKDFWNVYHLEEATNSLRQITGQNQEFGYPHWQFGDCRLTGTSRQLVAIASSAEGDSLWFYDLASQREVSLKFASTLESLMMGEDGKIVVIERPFSGLARLLRARVEGDSLITTAIWPSTEFSPTITAPTTPDFKVSLPQHLEYATRDGAHAFAFFYAPKNTHYACDDRPPVLVMVHGGPTARAYAHFDIQKQFWTSHGFAVLDVNHRGSSGYGRQYRDALKGNWGELDCTDIIDAIAHVTELGWVDPSAVCIRGKSAGGFAVLRALTEYPGTFAAGASYYGIGDLATLAQITHKFEKFYTDSLIGEVYNESNASATTSRFVTRSPVHQIEHIKAPMILFQGADDKVVPPALARDFVEPLKAQKLEYEYYEFEGEGHGFKATDVKRLAWQKELAFYRKILRKKALN